MKLKVEGPNQTLCVFNEGECLGLETVPLDKFTDFGSNLTIGK